MNRKTDRWCVMSVTNGAMPSLANFFISHNGWMFGSRTGCTVGSALDASLRIWDQGEHGVAPITYFVEPDLVRVLRIFYLSVFTMIELEPFSDS